MINETIRKIEQPVGGTSNNGSSSVFINGNPVSSPNFIAAGTNSLVTNGNDVIVSGQQVTTGSLTGSFYPLLSNPNNYITSSETGQFASLSHVLNVSGVLNSEFSSLQISGSSETVSGVIKIATQAEVNNGTNDTNAVTPAKLKNTTLIRERLMANRTYYVSTTGSDSNNGLTAGTPFLLIQKAINVALGLDFNGYTVTIQLADGTYTAGAYLGRPVLGGTLVIKGNASSPSSVVISTTSANAIRVSNNAILTVQDMRLQTTTSGSCILAEYGGTVHFGNIDFHGCASAHIRAEHAATINCFSNYSITGGAQYHILAENTTTVMVTGRAVTLTGTPNFSQYFVLVQRLACAFLSSNTFSGSATGARYRADLNGVIGVSGAGATYLPGDSAGTTSTGGIYA